MFRRHKKTHRRPPCRLTKVVLISVFGLILVFVTHQSETTKSVQSQNMVLTNGLERCRVLNVSNPEGVLSKLTELDLRGCGLKEIPASIRYATNIRKLDVSSNPLLTLPSELRYCTKIEILFASSCPTIPSLPKVLGKMKSITRLGWRGGSLKAIDPDGLPPNLVHLILTDNQITSLDDPRILKKMRNVRKLMLSHNKLSSFGKEGGVELLENLELLRLGDNSLNEIPDALWNLPKLSWLTISGNPVTNEIQSKMPTKVPSIKMSDLNPKRKYLGQGASGKVELYEWQKRDVAVKLIHGVTSDGNAQDELAIYNAVGPSAIQHRVVGSVALLDGEQKGIVMEALPPDLDDFALPPTIIEVTEDRWDNSSSAFSASFVKNALDDSLTAITFLHKAGVSHGDFYAHNMKVDRRTGRVYLLDFGASYFKGKYAKQAEKLEVRAFGVLVGDLIRQMNSTIESLTLKEKLLSLHSQCTNEIVSERPSLSEIKIMMKSF